MNRVNYIHNSAISLPLVDLAFNAPETKVNTLRQEVNMFFDYFSALCDKHWKNITIYDDFLCKVLDGYRKKELTLIAGPKKKGRTALLVNIAMQLQSELFPVLFFSPRLSNRELAIVFLCASLKLDISKILNPEFNKTELDTIDWGKIKFLSKFDNILIDDSVPLLLQYIKEKVKYYKTLNILNLIIIDDLDLICFNKANSFGNKIKIIKSLRQLARNQEIHIIINKRLNNNFPDYKNTDGITYNCFKEIEVLEKYVDNIILVNKISMQKENDKSVKSDFEEFLELFPYKTPHGDRSVRRYKFLSQFCLVMDE